MTVLDGIKEISSSTLEIERASVSRIFRCWIGYKNRRIFVYLRHAICRAEQVFAR